MTRCCLLRLPMLNPPTPTGDQAFTVVVEEEERMLAVAVIKMTGELEERILMVVYVVCGKTSSSNQKL